MERLLDDAVKVSSVQVAHEDDRRRLSVIFNGDFVAQQAKIIEVKKDSILGNHYHSYAELFYILEGEATYFLKSVNTGEKRVVRLRKGDRLLIAPEIAHKAEMTAGTITIEATEQLYMSPEVNDIKYEAE